MVSKSAGWRTARYSARVDDFRPMRSLMRFRVDFAHPEIVRFWFLLRVPHRQKQPQIFRLVAAFAAQEHMAWKSEVMWAIEIIGH